MNSKKKIIITGGAGFFGGHICEEALYQGNDVVVVDAFNSETSDYNVKAANIDILEQVAKTNNSNLSVYQCNITDESALTRIFTNEKPSILIHAAALVMDRASMKIPLEFIQTNVMGSQVILNATSKIDSIEQFVLISSRSAIGEVYGANSFMSEDDHFRPINPYGATKAAAEHLFHSFHHNNKIPLTICRMNPMYGPRGRPDMFIWRLLNSSLTGKQIEKYGTGDGIRDWLFVTDAVGAIFSIISKSMGFEIFNLGSGVGTSANKLIELAEEITGEKINIVEVDVPPGDAHFAGVADCSKVKKLIGWEATTELRKGMTLTFEYMKKHDR